MNVLVTGSAGFIGTALSASLIRAGHDLAGYDLIADHDVCDRKRFQAHLAAGVDVVVHLAAEVGKLNCEQNSSLAMRTNLFGTQVVAEACAAADVPLVFCSTSEVYGDYGGDEIDETAAFATKLSGVYALTKRWGEEICRTYAPEGLKIIRPTMPYGPGVPPGPGRRALDNLIWLAMTGQDLVVHRGARRSWCWIGDLARGIVAVIEQGEPGAYNVGRDDDDRLMFEVAAMACRLAEVPARQIKLVTAPERQTLVKRLSCAKLRALGWAPRVELDEGMPIVANWIRQWLELEQAA